MSIKNLLFIVIVCMLVLTSCHVNADSLDVEESSEQIIVSEIEVISDIPSQIESEPESENESIVETEPEDECTFYDVPFDLDTQEEIISICSEYNIPYELILGIISVESTFQPNVIGDSGKSFGLMQIQPRWWSKTMKREGITDLLDPLQNIKCGCAILQELQDKYGTEYRALQAYNTGNPNTHNGYAEKVYRYIDELVSYEETTLIEKVGD